MDQDLRNKIDYANAGHANPEEAFERVLDSLLILPSNIPHNPQCSWCNWRRGDSPRNLYFCGFHQNLRNNLRSQR